MLVVKWTTLHYKAHMNTWWSNLLVYLRYLDLSIHDLTPHCYGLDMITKTLVHSTFLKAFAHPTHLSKQLSHILRTKNLTNALRIHYHKPPHNLRFVVNPRQLSNVQCFRSISLHVYRSRICKNDLTMSSVAQSTQRPFSSRKKENFCGDWNM